jgi:phosphopantetheine adenylyltransferase
MSKPSLLLLPTPPEPITRESLSAAYRSSIEAVVSKLKELPFSTVLHLVLPCPSLHGSIQLPRSQIYDEGQRLVAGIYSLICIVCAKLQANVDSDSAGSIDTRVILLDYHNEYQNPPNTDSAKPIPGPLIDLITLAITRRQWNLIFSVDGEAGQKILAQYIDLANRQSPPLVGHMQVVGGGLSLVQRISPILVTPPKATNSHYIVAVGGTFDHLHAGHKLLLTATALLLQPTDLLSSPERRLIVGITGDELLRNKKYAEYLKSWKSRQEDVVDFLLSILCFARSTQKELVETEFLDEPGPNGRAVHTRVKSCSIVIECVEIQDPFGPTITDENITALVVSGETRSGGQAVNDKRVEHGWQALEVFEVDVLDARDGDQEVGGIEDFASKISSTQIRKRMAETARMSSL